MNHKLPALLALALLSTLGPASLNGCLVGECAADPIPPKHIAAVAGDGSVTLTWQISPETGIALDDIRTEVQYADTGSGNQCTKSSAFSLAEGCIATCKASRGTQCTIDGLTNGKAYRFTVFTTAYPHTLDCKVTDAYARSASVKPTAN